MVEVLLPPEKKASSGMIAMKSITKDVFKYFLAVFNVFFTRIPSSV